jgi:uncharacterized membrane protein YjjP (DUF1212 family)
VSIPEPLPTAPDPSAAIAFVIEAGRAMHLYGATAPAIEDAMVRCSLRFGLEAQVFTSPTWIHAAFGAPGHQRTADIRVEPGSVDLARRIAAEELISRALRGELAPSAGFLALLQLRGAPPIYPRSLALACFAAASASSACVFGGGWREIAASFVVGICVGAVVNFVQRPARLDRVADGIAALVASALAMLLAWALGGLSTFTVTVSGVIPLLPGLTITTAIGELAARHLASGSARFMYAMMTFFSMAFGIAVGRRVEDLLPVDVDRWSVAPAPRWVMALAVVLAPLAYLVLLNGRRQDALWVVGGGILGFVSGRLGSVHFGAEIGAFLGSLAVTLASGVIARWKRRAAAVTLIPGLLMLVPGSVGFRSLNALVRSDTLGGLDAAFHVGLVAVAIATGLFVAYAVSPPRTLDERM